MRVFKPSEVARGLPGQDPTARNEFPFRALATGDSWFAANALFGTNMLYQADGPDTTAVLSFARPGQQVVDAATDASLAQCITGAFATAWDAILISGGGQDVFDDLDRIVRPPVAGAASAQTAEDFIVLEALEETLAGVVRAYREIAALRDGPGSACPNAPIVVHTYDVVTPRHAPVTFLGLQLSGAPLFDACAAAGAPASLWNAISDRLSCELRRTLVALGGDTPAACPGSAAMPPMGLAAGGGAIANFLVADTRGVLVRADPGSEGVSNDWQNETHPTAAGFRKLATSRFNAAIAEAFRRSRPDAFEKAA